MAFAAPLALRGEGASLGLPVWPILAILAVSATSTALAVIAAADSPRTEIAPVG
ncbi:MAG: hypothetical protein R2706_05345 [Acidimicrobiales bacterium]